MSKKKTSRIAVVETADLDAEIERRMPGSKERTDAMQARVASERAERHREEEAFGIPSEGLRMELEKPKPEAPVEASEPTATEAERASAEALPGEVAPVVDEPPAPAEAAPTQSTEEFGLPSEAPKTFEENVNGLGQYKIICPDEKVRGYSRVTTYIDAIEDTSQLVKWKQRILLEGVATAVDQGEDVAGRIRDLVQERDQRIAQARKRDRKGKLIAGQLAVIIGGAYSDFKRKMNALVDEVFELGGGRAAATKGTDLHGLCERYDRDGMGVIDEMLASEEITPADHADVAAYAAATSALGLEVVYSEAVVVNDDLKVAGRLDRVYRVRLPEIVDPKSGEVVRPADRNVRRYVGDLKTSLNIEYSLGKTARQIALYATSRLYNEQTGERTLHRASRSTGILVHLPQGSGRCTIHLVDLANGAQGLRVVSQVRSARREGRKAIDTKIDLLALPEAVAG